MVGERAEERRSSSVLRWARCLCDIPGHQHEAYALAPAEITTSFVERLAILRGEPVEVATDKTAMWAEVQI